MTDSQVESAEQQKEVCTYDYGNSNVTEILGETTMPGSRIVSGLEFKTHNAKVFDFLTLLPEGYSLEKRQSLGTSFIDAVKKKLVHSEDRLVEGGFAPFFSQPGAFLELLHELGHIDSIENAIKARNPKSDQERESIAEELMKTEDERDAWAYAVKMLRKLRAEGINLEPELDSEAKIAQSVHLGGHRTLEKRKEPDFVPHKPSENVTKFLKENPNADWKQALNFVLDNYPQVVKGELVWILEGGAAVYLLNTARADNPDDVDIVTKSEPMAKDFTNTLTFNVDTTDLWCRFRRLEPSDRITNLLFSHHSPVDFMGRKVEVLDSVALTASKTIPWQGFAPQRQKDKTDIVLLSAPQDEVKELVTELTRK